MSPLRIGILVVLASLSQALGQELLQPPRNLTLASKDFDLFLLWLPADGYPPKVSYAVQWIDPFGMSWKDVSHCTDIFETVCNLTCVSPEINNRHRVRVKAQMSTSTGIISSTWVQLRDIEYTVQVELAPPILQVEKIENSLLVNTAFSYPSCVKDVFQHLTYDLEIWAVGTKFRMTFHDKVEKTLDINVTELSSGKYCLHARASFPTNKKRSNFSEPVCTFLHGKAENWQLLALPFLLMLSAGAFIVFLWYKNMVKRAKTPQTLDFSRYQGPKKLLEFGEREVIKVDALTCTAVRFVSGKRSQSGPQIYSTFSPVHSLSEEDEDEEEDDSGRPTTYTARKDMHHHLIAPGPFVLAECMVGEDASGFPDSKRSSFSEVSSVEESPGFPTNDPAAGAGQEDMSADIDILLQLPLPDCNFPTVMQRMAAGGHPEANHGSLQGSEIARFGIQDKQDFSEFLIEEQFIDERGSENDSSSCGRHMVEIPLLNVSFGDLENGVPGGNRDLELDNILEPEFCESQPRHTDYISRC
ncbi:interferon lambda receptor 1 [Elgaria multicarinata webbii]|uniref:interferon lambda receptor 1 n=1 Tax=Elgaria multicarinata webbii TaxID=159646 RepID=UPI002FCCC256